MAWLTTKAGAALTMLAILSVAAPAAAESTIDAVKKRGTLVCGVNGELPGFSQLSVREEWVGLDVDLCRAVAAAVLGDATRVKFVPLTAKQRFDALESGDIDVLARNSTVTLQRDSGRKVSYAAINYFDGQGFVVPKKLKVNQLASLSGAKVCFTRGTTHEANMVNWFRTRRLSVVPVGYDTQETMYDAFLGSRCAGVTQDASGLAASLVQRGKAADYLMLPEIISKEPLGPYVRSGDEEWLNVVRWSHYAMLDAEERGIGKANVEEQRRSHDPAVRLFLGVTPGNGKALGLDEAWAYNIISQVGNYGERFEFNLGKRSPLKLGRGINALWSEGGQMYAPPLR